MKILAWVITTYVIIVAIFPTAIEYSSEFLSLSLSLSLSHVRNIKYSSNVHLTFINSIDTLE